MRHPKVVFKLSKKVDLDVALAFRTMKAGGIDFRKLGLLAPHPELKKHKRLTRSILATYINRHYRQHGRDLQKTRLDFARKWNKTSDDFFSLTEALFGEGYPPPATYTCYLSIWNCNPRDIPHKSFQIFYKHKNPLETMTHEMLHFAFYAYVYKRYPHLKRSSCLNTLWELSEAFNTVILNSSKWRRKLQTKIQPPYPELRGLVRIMRGRWVQNQSINDLFDGFLAKKREERACSSRIRLPG